MFSLLDWECRQQMTQQFGQFLVDHPAFEGLGAEKEQAVERTAVGFWEPLS